MKFGIDTPNPNAPNWERIAFNGYAMECDKLDQIVNKLREGYSVTVDSLSDGEIDYIQRKLGEY